MPEFAAEGFTILRVSTADQVAALLRDKILSGELKPGTPLQEVPLATAIGVAPNTIREAMRVLVYEGLVQHSPRRGGFVTALTEEDVTDIYKLRRWHGKSARSTPGSTRLGLAQALTHRGRMKAATELDSF